MTVRNSFQCVSWQVTIATSTAIYRMVNEQCSSVVLNEMGKIEFGLDTLWPFRVITLILWFASIMLVKEMFT